MKTTKDIILAHDAFTQYGGAERVFDAAAELFPDQPIYSLVVEKDLRANLKARNVFTSPLQGIYNLYPHLTHLFALIPMVLKFWRPKSGEVLLSFSSAYIKGLRKPTNCIHVNYCHTPTRFLWIDPQWAYKEIPKILHPLARLYFTWLKRWDLNVVKNIDFFIANSLEVQKRIKQVYGRDSELLYPFIDVNFWQPTRAKQNYFLVAGRLQYAKGLETVIEVFNDLHLPLHVVGSGRFESNLRSIAKPNVHFLGRLSDEGLRDEYSGALGFIYPQFEDFGMMPLEAASCGTATIGLAKGGSLETIIPSETGELLTLVIKQTLTEAIQKWDVSKYKRETLQNHAAKFSKQIFQDGLLALMEKYGVSRNY